MKKRKNIELWEKGALVGGLVGVIGTLLANETYNYTICTGSYPQIHHTAALRTANGWINCTEFTDVNGKVCKDGIPAIRLE